MQRNSSGLAIATILLAIVLIAAIAVTIAMSSRSGAASSSQQQDKLFATNIMNQAQQLKNGVALAMSNGVDISTITAVMTTPETTFSPASAGISSIIVPLQASTATNATWTWHGAGALVKIMNVGSGIGNYVIELNPLTKGVCQQINQGLFGNPGILTMTSSGTDWGTPSATDASTDTAVDGKEEGCFYNTSAWWGPAYFYYKVILVQ